MANQCSELYFLHGHLPVMSCKGVFGKKIVFLSER